MALQRCGVTCGRCGLRLRCEHPALSMGSDGIMMQPPARSTSRKRDRAGTTPLRRCGVNRSRQNGSGLRPTKMLGVWLVEGANVTSSIPAALSAVRIGSPGASSTYRPDRGDGINPIRDNLTFIPAAIIALTMSSAKSEASLSPSWVTPIADTWRANAESAKVNFDPWSPVNRRLARRASILTLARRSVSAIRFASAARALASATATPSLAVPQLISAN